MSDEFDIDAGVDAIAADMGWDSEEETTEEVVEEVVEEETAEEVIEEEPEAEKVQAKAPPASWAKDKHEIWNTLTPEAQAYYEQREKQMLDGLEQYKQGYQFANEVQQAIAPYQKMFEQYGVQPVQAIGNLLQWNQALQSGTLEQRQQALIQLGNDLGLIPKEGQPQIDPHTAELQQRLARIEQQEQQRAQQAYQQNLAKVTSEVEAFANDPANGYFEEVAEDVIQLLKTGLDLKSAYEKAVWANPITRAKEQSRLIEEKTKELTAKKTEEAKKALKATSGNVKPAKTTRETQAPTGSWDQTMQETLEKLRS